MNADCTSTISTATMLQHGIFKCQCLEEAKTLAEYLAGAYPNPRQVVVGILEVLLNAIEHGNLHISYKQKAKLQQSEQWLEEIERCLQLPENAQKFVTVEFTRDSKAITLVVTDAGEGFDWRKYQTIDVKRMHDTHGRGIAMAKSLAFSEMRYNDKGNQVTCVVELGGC